MKCSTFLGMIAVAAALQTAGAAEIIGAVTLSGTPPPEVKYTPLMADPTCGKLHKTMPTTHFYVVGANSGLGDVVVSLQGISGQSTGASAKPAELDQKGCLYHPQILAVQTGQKILVKNSDPVIHNIDIQPSASSGNQPFNLAQMPGTPPLTVSFSKPEMFIKVKCDVHPWMFAWISVFDHPYFAVTDKDGHFKIENVKPGTYTIEAIHRKAGKETKTIQVKEGAPTEVNFVLKAP